MSDLSKHLPWIRHLDPNLPFFPKCDGVHWSLVGKSYIETGEVPEEARCAARATVSFRPTTRVLSQVGRDWRGNRDLKRSTARLCTEHLNRMVNNNLEELRRARNHLKKIGEL